MKKLVSILLSVLILASVIIAVPTLASGAVYTKGTVIKVTFTADDVDTPFTALEGSLTFGEDLTLDDKSVSFPNVSDMQSAVYEGKIVFNASSLSNYNISSDKKIVSAEFTVNKDISDLPVSAELEDIYYRDGAKLINIVNVPYALNADVSVVFEPETSATGEITTTPSTQDETEPYTGSVVETTESISEPVNTNTTEEISEPVNTNTTEETSELVNTNATQEITEPDNTNVTQEITEPVNTNTTQEITGPVNTDTTEEITNPVNTDATEVVPTGESVPSTDSTEPSVVPIPTDETGILPPTDSTEFPTGTGVNPTDPNPTAQPETLAPTQAPTGATDPSEAKTEITLSKTSAKLYVKGTTKIKAAVKNGKGATSYTSNKPKIAKVDKNGKVTALKKGTAVITVGNNGVKKTFTVKVKNPKLNKKKVKLKKGKTFKLKVIGKKGKAKFKSSKKKIATVSKSGKIKAKKKGKATITVITNGKIKLKCKVIVK
jgi:hypothetical protein